MRHLIDIQELSTSEIEELIAVAEDIIAKPEKYRDSCRYKKLATLFFEPSTRTRLSFEAAMIELGGSVIGFSEAQSSSAAKGESVADTAKVISCFADIMVMRHFKEGAPMVASLNATVPVINAGDGGHNHPTQTLTDLLTIKREKGRFDNLTVGLCGDLKFGRTVHSLIAALSRYTGIKFVLISPTELTIPDYIKHDVIEKNNIDAIIGAEGLVTAAIDNVSAQGQVKLGAMEWTARSTSGKPIPQGTLIRVDRIEGVKVFVSPVEIPAAVQ